MKMKSCMVLLVLLVGVGCAGPKIEFPAPSVHDGVRVETTGLYRDPQTYAVTGICGVATNESGKDLRLCIIHFDILNEQGEKVADCLASSNGLSSGMKWRFQAVFINPFSVTFRKITIGRVQAM